MIRSVTIVTLLLAVVSASEIDYDAESSAALAAPREDREMVSIQVGDLVCPYIESAFRGQATCECDIPINWPLAGSYTDVTCTAPICGSEFGIACLDLVFGAKVQVGPISVEASVCVDNIRVFDFTFPEPADLCIDYPLIPRQKSSIIKGCNAKVNGKKCIGCKLCDRFGGVNFDCTNIVAGFKSTRCAQFRPYLGQGSNPVAKVPAI
jgi:hypothetical protein